MEDRAYAPLIGARDLLGSQGRASGHVASGTSLLADSQAFFAMSEGSMT